MNSMANPNTESSWIGRSTVTQPSTEGPRMIPTMISATTVGSFTAGNRPSTNGTANAAMTTTNNPMNETSGTEITVTAASPYRYRSLLPTPARHIFVIRHGLAVTVATCRSRGSA